MIGTFSSRQGWQSASEIRGEDIAWLENYFERRFCPNIMSSIKLDKIWKDAQKSLEEVVDIDSQLKISKDVGLNELLALAHSYVKFVQIMRKLEECYSCMVHPQKRALIKRLLIGVMGRVVEIKHDIVVAEFCETVNWNPILSELSLIPEDIVIPIPKYFLWEKTEILNNRDLEIQEIQSRFGLIEEKSKSFVSTTEEAVLLIQRMERARQGQQRAILMLSNAAYKQGEKTQISTNETFTSSMDPHLSASKIQRVWKGFSTWQKIQKEREEEMSFLGMTYSPDDEIVEAHRLMEKFEQRIRELHISSDQICQAAFNSIKDKFLYDQGDSIKENLEGEIRSWFFTYKQLAGKFPEYPSDEEGGYQSALLTGVEQIILKEQEEEKIRLHKKKKAKAEKKPPGTHSKTKISKKVTEREGSAPKKLSNCLQELMSSSKVYKSIWEEKLNKPMTSYENQIEVFDKHFLQNSAKEEVEIELKKQVDELMRQELQLLKMALLKDKGKKGKKLKAAVNKKKKGKFGVKKRKKEKDFFPGRTVESLFEELVRERIIKKCPTVFLNDYIGEDNLVINIENDICPVLSPSDVRRILTEYCILPLGCPFVHLKCPLIRSILLVGSSKSGKTMLAHAICTELGATLIDLSPHNLVGKYSSREDLRIMFNIVSKVSRIRQPTIILVKDADLMFSKGAAKIDKSDPKRLKKGLQKLIKGITTEDLVLVIGTAKRPFDCDMKALTSTFNKMILLPRPNHASRTALWRRKIRSMGGDELGVVDFGNLVKMTDGYSSGVIVNAIAQVLSAHRVALQKRKPLQLQEFIVALSKTEPVYKEEEEALKNWSYKTPLSKKRTIALEPEESKKAREKLLMKKRKQMELEKRFYGGEKKGKAKRKGKKS